MSGRLPNLLLVGAPRSGSTYLARNLGRHPDVFIARTGHEYSTGDVHFFDLGKAEGRQNAAAGLDWYRGLFADAGARRWAGEKTADYLADPDAPRRIRETLGPDVRLIACLREPVSRAHSHYWHEKPGLPLFLDFETAFFDPALNERIWLQASGLYHRNLTRYLEVFEPSQVRVLVHEDLMRDPHRQLADLCRFLEIDDRFRFPFAERRINQTVSSGAPYWTMRTAGLLKRAAPSLFASLVDSGLARRARALVRDSRGIPPGSGDGAEAVPRGGSGTGPALEPRQVERIRDFYRPDVGALGDLLGRDMRTFWWGPGGSAARGTDLTADCCRAPAPGEPVPPSGSGPGGPGAAG